MNDVVDRLEEPEVMLRHAIREMEDSLAEATGSAARVIATETLLSRQKADHERRAARWQARAESAVAAGDEDSARAALTQRLEHEALAESIGNQATAAQGASLSLRRQVEAMRTKFETAKRQLSTLIARRKAASASRALSGLAQTPETEFAGFARFDRMQEQVEHAEAEAQALLELNESRASSREAEFENQELRARIERELTAIKAKRSGGS